MRKEKIYLEDGRVLGEDEYLLKTYKMLGSILPTQGFLTKLNQDNSIPVRFDEWKTNYHNKEKLPYTIVKEEFKIGWKLYKARYGESQNWAIMIHPDGYTIEIYMNSLIKLLQENSLVNGQLIGAYKWENHNLIRQK